MSDIIRSHQKKGATSGLKMGTHKSRTGGQLKQGDKINRETAPTSGSTAQGGSRRNLSVQDVGQSRPYERQKGSSYSKALLLESGSADEQDHTDMVKRKDGSKSQRGLWDNIRAKKARGEKMNSPAIRMHRQTKQSRTVSHE